MYLEEPWWMFQGITITSPEWGYNYFWVAFLSTCNLVTRQTAFPYSVIMFLLLKIAELTVKYAELEEKLLEMRAKSRAEAERFFDEEIDCRLDIISRQVARIDTRLFTYHEVIIRIIQRFTFLYLIHKYKYILTVCCYCLSHKTWGKRIFKHLKKFWMSGQTCIWRQ